MSISREILAHDPRVQHYDGAWVVACPACEAEYHAEMARYRRAADVLDVTPDDPPPAQPVEDGGMVLVWVVALIAFVVVMGVAAALIAERSRGG